jgi:hypothetical protein
VLGFHKMPIRSSSRLIDHNFFTLIQIHDSVIVEDQESLFGIGCSPTCLFIGFGHIHGSNLIIGEKEGRSGPDLPFGMFQS